MDVFVNHELFLIKYKIDQNRLDKDYLITIAIIIYNNELTGMAM